MLTSIQKFRLLFLWCSILVSSVSFADDLNKALKIGENTARSAAESSKKIAKLDDETAKLLAEYRAATKESESLQVYNRQLEDLLQSQSSEIARLNSSLENIDDLHRDLMPLMERMITALEKFIELDLPFLKQERVKRVAKLNEYMKRADVSISEKLRKIFEAYQVERQYGRSIEVYRGVLEEADGKRDVEYLRVGRLALYQRSLDQKKTALFDPGNAKWLELSSSQARDVEQVFKVAKQLLAADFLRVPMITAERKS